MDKLSIARAIGAVLQLSAAECVALSTTTHKSTLEKLWAFIREQSGQVGRHASK